MLPRTLESVRHVASIVMRPVDTLSEVLKRPASERRPVRPVRFRIAGVVVAGVVQPLAGRLPKSVFNLSGDTVVRDFALPAGKYRIEIGERTPDYSPARPRPLAVRDVRLDGVYEDIDPLERDLDWDPAAPLSGLPGLPGHPSRLVTIHLYPAPAYPFPTGSTLVRGSFLWYDGSALSGAVARLTSAIIPRSRVGPLGDFVLPITANAATGVVSFGIDRTAVDASTRIDGAAYLATWPLLWPATWERGTSRSVRQGALSGTVRRADGRMIANATVKLAGRPGIVRTDGAGRWRYHFPPLTPAATVDITVQHPNHPAVTITNIAFPADATAAAPTVVMS